MKLKKTAETAQSLLWDGSLKDIIDFIDNEYPVKEHIDGSITIFAPDEKDNITLEYGEHIKFTD